MTYNKSLIQSRDDMPKRVNIGKNTNTYRTCAGIPLTILAERMNITQDEMSAIERGTYKKLTIEQILHIAEELGISYADLYEADEDIYYSNIKDFTAFAYIFKRIHEYKPVNLAAKLGSKTSFLNSCRNRNYVPSPFVLGNILTLLNITSVDLRNANIYAQGAKEEIEAAAMPTEPDAPNVDALNEVIKAVNVYKNVETLKTELNEIISKAQKLLEMLGA